VPDELLQMFILKINLFPRPVVTSTHSAPHTCRSSLIFRQRRNSPGTQQSWVPGSNTRRCLSSDSLALWISAECSLAVTIQP